MKNNLSKNDLRFKEWLSVKDVIEYTNIGRDTVYEIMRDERAEAIFIKGKFKIRKTDLDNFLKKYSYTL